MWPAPLNYKNISAMIKKASFQFSLLLLLFTTTLFTGFGVTLLNYYDGKKMIRQLSHQLFGEISIKSFSLIQSHFKKIEQFGILNEAISKNLSLKKNEIQDFFYQVLENVPELTYMSMADRRGDALAADFTSRELKIHQWNYQKDGTSIIKEYQRDKKAKSYSLLKQSQKTYDPRTRPWYQIPLKKKRPVWLDPFLWHPEQVPGITYAVPSLDEKGKLKSVFTIDIQLSFISQALKNYYPYKSGLLFIVNEEGSLIAHNKLNFKNKTQEKTLSLPHVSQAEDLQTQHSFNQWVNSNKKTNLYFSFEGQRFILKSKHLKISKNISWYILMSVSEKELLYQAFQSLHRSIILSILILGFVISLSLFISRYLSNSFNRIFKEMKDIFHFSFEKNPPLNSFVYEMNKISNYLANIKSSLRSFEKYIPPILVKKYLREGIEASLGGEEKEVTIMFIDIENYTKLSESISKTDLIKFLNEFSRIVTQNIERFGGTVDKFIGDSVMAFWGGLKNFEDHALLATQCSQSCYQSIKNSDMNINIRIGINTGGVIIGNFGSEERFNFTVLGDNVNQASRLENSNKIYGTNILISEQTFSKVYEQIPTRKIDHIILKGREGITTLYEVLDPQDQGIKVHYEKALFEYQSQNWEKAIEHFNYVLKMKKNDGPSLLLKNRSLYYQTNPPSKNWNGTFGHQ